MLRRCHSGLGGLHGAVRTVMVHTPDDHEKHLVNEEMSLIDEQIKETLEMCSLRRCCEHRSNGNKGRRQLHKLS